MTQWVGLGWTRPTPGTGNSFWVSQMSDRSPSFSVFPNTLAGSWTGRKTAGTPTGAHMECCAGACGQPLFLIPRCSLLDSSDSCNYFLPVVQIFSLPDNHTTLSITTEKKLTKTTKSLSKWNSYFNYHLLFLLLEPHLLFFWVTSSWKWCLGNLSFQ